jgi:hypothetical protein
VSPAADNLLACGDMLLGLGEMLFEHFAHPASLHGLSGDAERRSSGHRLDCRTVRLLDKEPPAPLMRRMAACLLMTG